MTNNRIVQNYRCSQSELYAGCRIGWLSFQNQLTTFSSKKAFYDAANATSSLMEIDRVQALPDAQTRSEVSESSRIRLVQKADECLTHWQLMRSYILSAYAAEFQKAKVKAAGGSYYASARKNTWEDVRSITIAGNTFIVENQATLLAQQNMPAAFPADYLASMNMFLVEYDLFKFHEREAFILTQKKQQANNAIYNQLMQMLKDGQLYFKNDPALRQQFTFEFILQSVTGVGGAGLIGSLRDARTNAVIATATLALYDGTELSIAPQYSTISDANGKYDFGALAGGTYTLKIESVSYVSIQEELEIASGVRSTQNFMMIGV